MLPLQIAPRSAAWWVLLNTGGTVLAALALALRPNLGWIYLAPVVGSSVAILALNLRLIRQPDRQRALALFHASNLYLAIVILMACIDALVG